MCWREVVDVVDKNKNQYHNRQYYTVCMQYSLNKMWGGNLLGVLTLWD